MEAAATLARLPEYASAGALLTGNAISSLPSAHSVSLDKDQ
jgi:hypothetical protein